MSAPVSKAMSGAAKTKLAGAAAVLMDGALTCERNHALGNVTASMRLPSGSMTKAA